MTKYDINSQVEEYFGTFAAEPANEDMVSLSSYSIEEYEEYISKESQENSEI